MIQIKGCPFCGSSTVIVEPKKVRCIKCEALVPGRDQEEAIRKWNGRVVKDLEMEAFQKGVEAVTEGLNKQNAGYDYFSKLSEREIGRWVEGYKAQYEFRYNEKVQVSVQVGCSEVSVIVGNKTFVDHNE
ncbi:MAG TPA: hypothetical protein PLP63_06750 [Saprospiraceae bacterium]|nr:hypothetical protein [Saprospiraceae bacterium]